MPHLRNDETDLERGSVTSQIEVPKSNISKTRLSPPQTCSCSCELYLRWACPSTLGLNQNFMSKPVLLPLQHFPYLMAHQIPTFYLYNSPGICPCPPFSPSHRCSPVPRIPWWPASPPLLHLTPLWSILLLVFEKDFCNRTLVRCLLLLKFFPGIPAGLEFIWNLFPGTIFFWLFCPFSHNTHYHWNKMFNIILPPMRDIFPLFSMLFCSIQLHCVFPFKILAMTLSIRHP